MPCRRWPLRMAACQRGQDLPRPSSNPDIETWRDIRKFNLRKMRSQVRHIVLFMALIEALRIGPVQIVFAGKEGHSYPAPGKDDFGIAYTMGYFLSWLYLCIFMMIWVPFFQPWVDKIWPDTPEDPSKPSFGRKVVCVLQKMNMVLLPIAIGIHLLTYVYYVFHTFIYVDNRNFGSKKLPKNTRRNWAVRAFMLVGIAMTTSLGYGAFQILAQADLAHVKCLEYCLIVVPVQINLGILLGSVMQFRMERRLARKQQLAFQTAKAEEGTVDEKAALVEV